MRVLRKILERIDRWADEAYQREQIERSRGILPFSFRRFWDEKLDELRFWRW